MGPSYAHDIMLETGAELKHEPLFTFTDQYDHQAFLT